MLALAPQPCLLLHTAWEVGSCMAGRGQQADACKPTTLQALPPLLKPSPGPFKRRRLYRTRTHTLASCPSPPLPHPLSLLLLPPNPPASPSLAPRAPQAAADPRGAAPRAEHGGGGRGCHRLPRRLGPRPPHRPQGRLLDHRLHQHRHGAASPAWLAAQPGGRRGGLRSLPQPVPSLPQPAPSLPRPALACSPPGARVPTAWCHHAPRRLLTPLPPASLPCPPLCTGQGAVCGQLRGAARRQPVAAGAALPPLPRLRRQHAHHAGRVCAPGGRQQGVCSSRPALPCPFLGFAVGSGRGLVAQAGKGAGRVGGSFIPESAPVPALPCLPTVG